MLPRLGMFTMQINLVPVSLQFSALLVLVFVHFVLAFPPDAVCPERHIDSRRANELICFSCWGKNNCFCQIDVFVPVLCYATYGPWCFLKFVAINPVNYCDLMRLPLSRKLDYRRQRRWQPTLLKAQCSK